MGSMKTFYFLKNQDWLKFLKPAERAEIDAATQAFHDSEDRAHMRSADDLEGSRTMSGGDIRYLLDLGLTIEEIAKRAGRTPLAITTELDKDENKDADA